MTQRIWFAVLILCCWCGWIARGELFEPGPSKNPDAAATLIVYNRNDPSSGDLAQFYAQKRGIPPEQIVALSCPMKEEITRDEYDQTIAEPLRLAFTKNGWWDLRPIDHPLGRVERNRIRFIALMRGMPLKIAPTSGYAGDKQEGQPAIAAKNEASVDSELAVLATFTRTISGALMNPYFRSYANIRDTRIPDLMLVCRLDAATPEIVRRMITDSIATEKEGLNGFAYIDARGIKEAGFEEGDKWLFQAADIARRKGLPVILDNGEGLFPESYPMSDAAVYLGWYAADCVGPFVRPDFRFRRGAIAVHIHSFSADTMRDPHKHWAAPLLNAGAAATIGNVYEPFLTLTPNLNIFFDRLRSGFTFAEASWMSERATSWMTTFIGDPLYRPFPVSVDLEKPNPKNAWSAYKEGAKIWFSQDHAAGATALNDAATRLESGLIWEGLGLLQLTADHRSEALQAFEKARQTYRDRDDVLRATIHEVIQLRALHREAEAAALVNQQMKTYANAPAMSLLRSLAPQPTPAGAN